MLYSPGLPNTLRGFALWATLAWAAAGAIAGDAGSYWLGRHYRAELHNRCPFRRHPKLLEKGTAFFQPTFA